MNFKKIILITFILLFITGCGCEKNSNKIISNDKILTTNITLEIPMKDVDKLEIKSNENEKAYIKVGKTFKIITLITPKDTSNQKLKWVVTNPKIIDISDSGVVTSLKVGKSNVTAYSTDGTNIKSNTITIEVLE